MPADSAPGWLVRMTAHRALLIAALFYALTTGYGVITDGYHSDDWRHVHGTSPLWTALEGRWFLEVLYRGLLGERFLPAIQVALAFPCFYWIAGRLARHAAPAALVPAATLGIFAIGTTHIFMADALSFSSNVFAYPLALALAVAGFEAIACTAGRSRRLQVGAVALCGALLALTLSTYQTFALAGLIVPVLALLDIDRVPFGHAVRLALLGAIASVLAILLYLLLWRTYAALLGVEIVTERFRGANLEGLRDKLVQLPEMMKKLLTGSYMFLPFALRATMGLFSATALGLAALVGLIALLAPGRVGPRLLAPLRIAIGAGLAFFLFPILFWLGYEGDAPPARAFAYLGFWIATIFILMLRLAQGRLAPHWAGRATGLGAAVIGVVAGVFALTASAFWSDSARVGKRDENLARAILARVATLPGFDGTHFRIAGGTDYPELSWGSLAGWTSFHAGNPRLGIFREMYGLAEETHVLPVSPRACPAFPAADAAFMLEGTAYVCLEALPALPDIFRCTPLPQPGAGEICLGPRVVAHVADDCLPRGKDDPVLRVAFHYRGQSHAPDLSFTYESFALPVAGRCYTVALAPGIEGLDAINVKLHSPDGTLLWQEPIPAGRLGADG